MCEASSQEITPYRYVKTHVYAVQHVDVCDNLQTDMLGTCVKMCVQCSTLTTASSAHAIESEEGERNELVHGIL